MCKGEYADWILPISRVSTIDTKVTVPIVERIEPYPLYTSMDPNGGHEEITLHVKHFPQFVSPSEFDSMRVQLEDGGRSVPLPVVTFAPSGDFATLKALAPTRMQPQRFSGTVKSKLLPYLVPLPFTIEYINQPPSVLHVDPVSGPSNLKVEEASTVEILLQHFSPVKDTEDVTIVNVGGDVWKVAERVYFTFQYNDNRFKVKSPESLCAAELKKDEYSALANCLVYSPASTLVVEVVDFQIVLSKLTICW